MFDFEHTYGFSARWTLRNSWKYIAMPTTSASAKATTDHTALIQGEPRLERGSIVTENLLTIWLKQRLQQFYSAMATEPIPEELLRLIEGGGKSEIQQ